MLSRYGSKRYNVAKNEESWVKKNYGKFLATPQVVINNRKNTYRRKAQQWLLIVLPILKVLILTLSLSGCYAIAIQNGNLPKLPYIPYPNQLGTISPQSSLFTFGLIMNSFMMFIISLLRYKQICLLYDGLVNKCGFAFGIMSSLSTILIASVQPHGEIVFVNQLAIGVYVVTSILYIVANTYLTRKTPTISSKFLFFSRLILVEFILVFAIALAIFMHPKLSYRNNPPYNIAQISSWLLVSFLQLYTLTFVVDMRQLCFAFDVRIIPLRINKSYRRSHLLDSICEEDEEGTIITTADDNDNYFELRTEV